MKHGIKNGIWKRLVNATNAVAELTGIFCQKMKDDGFSDEIIANAADAYTAHLVDAIVHDLMLSQVLGEELEKIPPATSPMHG